MNRVLFIGRSGSGKTTLCQWLHDEELRYRKTQAVTYFDEAIDTPGEYLERRNFYSALIITACEADVIALVADPTVEENFLPPSLASVFTKPVLGIVTKCCLADKDAIKRAQRSLQTAGAREIFVVDTLAGIGLAELRQAFSKTWEAVT